jgi:hypothetical protein
MAAARTLDIAFIERPARLLKYDLIYPGDLASGFETVGGARESYLHF